MELKAYIRILQRKWLVILVIALLTFLATLVFTMKQPAQYETTATYVIRPRSTLVMDDEFVRALDIVSRRVEINTTFAEVANSRLIKSRAIEKLKLDGERAKGLSLNGRVVAGTNVMEITARGGDPKIVANLANVAGALTVDYVRNLYDVFELEQLDAAPEPGSPVGPNTPFNLGIGLALGLGLGIGLAFFSEYWGTSPQGPSYFNIIDRETGAFTRSYFHLRLRQELSRAKRNRYALSLGLIQIDFKENGAGLSLKSEQEFTRLAERVLEKSIRDEDVLARFDERIFALLLPDMNGEDARETMHQLRAELNEIGPEAVESEDRIEVWTTASVVTFREDMQGEQLLAEAVDGLKVIQLAKNVDTLLGKRA